VSRQAAEIAHLRVALGIAAHLPQLQLRQAGRSSRLKAVLMLLSAGEPPYQLKGADERLYNSIEVLPHVASMHAEYCLSDVSTFSP
jgi:hypothetical protein